MRKHAKKDRQRLLVETIERNPFTTDDMLATQFNVSVQTIRLDRMEIGIPELRKRVEDVANRQFQNEVRSLPLEDIIGDVIDLELDKRAISIFTIEEEHVFQRNKIARGHYLFAQANSLAVAVMGSDSALTAQANVKFVKSAQLGDRVICKVKVDEKSIGHTIRIVKVESYVDNHVVLKGTFEMYPEADSQE
ncbi:MULTISPECIES: transcription factor FapR [Brochothrix]|uniref:Fatty acid biosynthesis transcriptional regulator n=2 Tax=Brochothrix thermosphacta TaxID=2756 RepID=A0A1D2LRS4_BROTH|nr:MULTISPECIES: transcription factor FapR [Brochothrix]SLM94050.1 Phosphate:acyl-ACP acyltransferase PlsX [Brachybacterium faecium]ANZ94156.1 fatty acid biosynthesis transcriptional regulator [Brochothrix thermosphacta]ANZ97548.1 fatty acid biosynthesis transcriptional regulator [Brochothrix thermosphacta]ATF26992.1 fatty acid biosynthesis transcriptional regulator [Brochothrix thermosphacta]ATH86349.1 fatty acid biosynthesis transcriptional regulator [Brochothrix thermosphacta]